MSNTARKARKLAKEPFVRPSKIATPLIERFGFTQKSKSAQERLLEARGATLTEKEQKALDAARPAKVRPVRNYTR